MRNVQPGKLLKHDLVDEVRRLDGWAVIRRRHRNAHAHGRHLSEGSDQHGPFAGPPGGYLPRLGDIENLVVC